MQELSTRLARLAQGRRGIAIGLAGPPGIGKTYTATGALQTLGFRSLTLEASTPQALLAQLPRPAGLPAWVERALEQPLDPKKQATALTTWLVSLAPYVLHLDNLHEGSPEHQTLWQQVAAQVRGGRGVGLVATSRLVLPEPFETLWLSPLSREQAGHLLEDKARANLPTPALDWIHARAVGNSLFTLEYFRYLARKGHLYSDGERWHWHKPPSGGLPASVETVIAEVLQGPGLSEAARRALDTWAMLSAVGTQPDLETWARVAELSPSELHTALEELEQAGVRQNHTWTHPLYAEVARLRLGRETRRALARRAIEVLEGQPEATAELIMQAGLAASEVKQRLQTAAERLLGLGKPAEAGRLLAQATDYAEAGQQGLLALRAAELLEHSRPAQALGLVERAWRQGSFETQTCALYARLLGVSGQLGKAEAILQTLPPGARRPQQIELAAQAQEFARVIELFMQDPTRLPPYAQSRVHMALLHLGGLEEAYGHIEQSLQWPNLEPLDKTFFLGNLADFHTLKGNVAEAAQVQRERIDLLRTLSHPRDLARALAAQAEVLEMLGHLGECRKHLEEAIALYADMGDGGGYAWTRSRLGALLADMGPFEEAEEILLACVGDLELAGNLQHLAAAQINLAYLYLNWGNPSSAVLAVRHASEAVRWARECRSAVVESQALAILAWAEALRGQPQRGYENAQQGLALAESSDYGFGRALGCFASGLTQHALGKPAEGLSSLKQASQALHQMGFPAIAERLGLELDRLEDDPKRARARLEFFKKRGLNGLVGVGLRYFPQLGQPRQEASPQPLCRLEVLGRLRFFRGGRAVALGQRAGELLAYLLLAQLGGQDEVGLLELLDTCYPNQPENESKNALHQLLHRLRNSAGSEVVLRTSAGYALGTVGSDAADFLRQGDTKLWRGELLEGQSLLVPAMVRTRLQDRLMAAALQLMPANPSEAARLGQILLRTDPYDKTALALTLSALQHTGQAKGLDQIYHHAKLQFAEVGEPLPPDPATFMQSITLP